MKKTMKRVLCAVLVAVMLVTGMPLAYSSAATSISIGDKITLGTYNGEPITWVCVDIDDNGPLMLAEDSLCLKEYDAAGTSSYYHSDGWGYVRESRGSNCWYDSNIRQWLNTNGSVDYTHCPPSYSNELGFLSNFTEYELSAVKTVTQKTYVNSWEAKRSGYVDGGNTETYDVYKITELNRDYSSCMYQNITDKFFLLGQEQLYRAYKNDPDFMIASIVCFSRIAGNSGASYENVFVYCGSDLNSLGAVYAYNTYGIRPAFYLDVDEYTPNINENKISGTFYGDCKTKGFIVNVDTGDSVVNMLEIDGVTYDIDLTLSRDLDIINNQNKYEDNKVVAIVEKGEIVWIKTVTDIRSGLRISLSFSDENIDYSNKFLLNDYSKKNIDVTVRISNVAVDFPSNADMSVFYEIPELFIEVDSLNIASSNPTILNFDGNFFTDLDIPYTSIPYGESATIETTAKININQTHKIDESIEKETVTITANAKAKRNGTFIENSISYPITITNLDNLKLKQEVNKKEIEKIAKKLEKFIKGLEVFWLNTDITGNFNILEAFNENELKSIEAELFYVLMAGNALEKKKQSFGVNVVDKLLGIESEWFSVNSNSATITKAKYIKGYGNAKIIFTCELTDYFGGVSDGNIYCEIIGENKTLKRTHCAYFSRVNFNDFSSAMDDFIDDMDLKLDVSSTSDIISDSFNTVFDMNLREVLKKAGFDNLLDMGIKGISFVKKQNIVYCPVDIYVYNSANEIVACIKNNEVVLSTENAQASVVGDTKIIWLSNDIFRVEYFSLAKFDMKVVVKEFGNTTSHLRTTTIDNIPLEIGTNFTQTIDNSILDNADYSLISNSGTTYNPTNDVIELHNHVVDEKLELVKESTCFENGFYYGLCSICSDLVKIMVDPIDHICSEWIVDIDPTCTLEGSKHIECTACETVIKTEIIPKLSHTYEITNTVSSTCTKNGLTVYTCACGDSYSETVKAKGHSYGDDGICVNCDDYNKAYDKTANDSENCSHLCHKGGFMGFIWKIVQIFIRLFKTNPVCECGAAHY